MSDSVRMRRVILLHPFDAWAGSQRVFVVLVQALQGLGVPVDVRLGFGTDGFVSQLKSVHRFLGINHVPIRKLLYPFWIVALIPRMLRAAYGGDIVWANTVHAIPAVLPMLLFAPRRVVLHVHEIEFPRLFHWLLRLANARRARVLCVSNLHRERLGVEAHVLPNCVDGGSGSEPLEPPVVLFVGAISALKGFPLFVDVARRLPPGRVRTAACVPNVPQAAHRWVENAEAANVEIRRGLSDPSQMFAGATLLLQCTDPALWTETFSLVMVESLACGVPVATAGMAVAPEILGAAWAFDVPSRDPDSIAAEISTLLDDAPRLQRLRTAARERSKNFTFQVFQNHISKVLDGVSEG